MQSHSMYKRGPRAILACAVFVCCAMVLFLCANAHAKLLTAEQIRGQQTLLPYCMWLPDPDNKHDIEIISSGSSAERFAPLRGGIPLKSSGSVWIRLMLVKSSMGGTSPQLVMNLGELPPGTTQIYFSKPAGQFSDEAQGWHSEIVTSHEDVLLPDPGLVPVNVYIHMDEMPGLWFNPTVTPKNAVQPAAFPYELAVPVLLLIACVFCLLRAVVDRAQWAAWAALYLGCALASCLLPLPALSGGFAPEHLPALLAPGMALILLPHIGRCMFRAESSVQDMVLYLCSFIGVAVALIPLIPGFSWLTRLFPLWPILAAPLLPLCLGALAMRRPGALAYAGACAMPVLGGALALYALQSSYVHPLGSQAGLLGVALGGLGLVLARVPKAAPVAAEEENTDPRTAGLFLAERSVDAAKNKAAESGFKLDAFSRHSQYDDLPPLEISNISFNDAPDDASSAASPETDSESTAESKEDITEFFASTDDAAPASSDQEHAAEANDNTEASAMQTGDLTATAAPDADAQNAAADAFANTDGAAASPETATVAAPEESAQTSEHLTQASDSVAQATVSSDAPEAATAQAAEADSSPAVEAKEAFGLEAALAAMKSPSGIMHADASAAAIGATAATKAAKDASSSLHDDKKGHEAAAEVQTTPPVDADSEARQSFDTPAADESDSAPAEKIPAAQEFADKVIASAGTDSAQDSTGQGGAASVEEYSTAQAYRAPRVISLVDDELFNADSGFSEDASSDAERHKSFATDRGFLFNLHSLVRDVHDIVAPLAKMRGILFSWYISPTLPGLLEGDAPRLRGALTLLLQNAVQATRKGAVQLSVRKSPGATERSNLLFMIHDNGSAQRTDAGFFHAWELAARTGGVFNVEFSPLNGTQISFTVRFSLPSEEAARELLDVDAEERGKYLSGLENEDILPIIDSILTPADGGWTGISSASYPDEDPWLAQMTPEEVLAQQDFLDPLPLSGAEAPEAVADAPAEESAGTFTAGATSENIRIIAAEMTTSNRRLLAHYLADFPHEHCNASDNKQVLELAAQGPVALVIFDGDMPEPEVVSIIKALRGSDSAFGPVPSLVLTSHDSQSKRMLERGAAFVLEKPFQKEALQAVVCNAIPALEKHRPDPDYEPAEVARTRLPADNIFAVQSPFQTVQENAEQPEVQDAAAPVADTPLSAESSSDVDSATAADAPSVADAFMGTETPSGMDSPLTAKSPSDSEATPMAKVSGLIVNEAASVASADVKASVSGQNEQVIAQEHSVAPEYDDAQGKNADESGLAPEVVAAETVAAEIVAAEDVSAALKASAAPKISVVPEAAAVENIVTTENIDTAEASATVESVAAEDSTASKDAAEIAGAGAVEGIVASHDVDTEPVSVTAEAVEDQAAVSFVTDSADSGEAADVVVAGVRSAEEQEAEIASYLEKVKPVAPSLRQDDEEEFVVSGQSISSDAAPLVDFQAAASPLPSESEGGTGENGEEIDLLALALRDAPTQQGEAVEVSLPPRHGAPGTDAEVPPMPFGSEGEAAPMLLGLSPEDVLPAGIPSKDSAESVAHTSEEKPSASPAPNHSANTDNKAGVQTSVRKNRPMPRVTVSSQPVQQAPAGDAAPKKQAVENRAPHVKVILGKPEPKAKPEVIENTTVEAPDTPEAAVNASADVPVSASVDASVNASADTDTPAVGSLMEFFLPGEENAEEHSEGNSEADAKEESAENIAQATDEAVEAASSAAHADEASASKKSAPGSPESMQEACDVVEEGKSPNDPALLACSFTSVDMEATHTDAAPESAAPEQRDAASLPRSLPSTLEEACTIAGADEAPNDPALLNCNSTTTESHVSSILDGEEFDLSDADGNEPGSGSSQSARTAPPSAFPLPGIEGEFLEATIIPLAPGIIYALKDAKRDMQEGCEVGRSFIVQEAAGRLAGKAEAFGLVKLGKISRCVERAAEADDMEAVTTLMEDLVPVINKYLDSLQECFDSFLNLER